MRGLFTALGGLATLVAAQNSGVRCRSEPTEQFVQESRVLQEGVTLVNRDVAAANTSKLLLDMYFHVVTATEGEITEDQLQKQAEVLNDNYGPYDIQFTLRGIDWTVNETWAQNEYSYYMKQKLRKGDYKTLNLYFVSSLDGGNGECTFPVNSTNPTFETSVMMDGCTLAAQTVPGGTKEGYNLGKTATHEVGHWFGLYHTFYGGCTYGDGIDDTPAQEIPGSVEVGCEKPIDSCPDQPGDDPMFNYMDYTGDACYREFTPGQKARMFENFEAYRANF